jgi:hypothetical protein
MASNRGPGAIQPEYQRDAAPSQPYVPGGGHSAHAGAVGGSWGSAPAPAVVHHHPGQSYSTPSITINSVPGASSGTGGTAASDGTFERNLILELCPAGGMKPAPPPDKLANFARTCASLNSDLVCPVLLDCLEEGQPWIIRAKALCTMEAAIANGMKADGTNPYLDFFFACRDEISPLGAHPRSAIHEPARRVLALLGVSAESIPATVSAAPAPNLLDFDDEPAAAVPPPPPSAAPPPPPDTGASSANTMFGGMQVKSNVTPLKPNAPQAAVAPPGASAPSSNLLDFESMVASAPAPAGTDVFETSAAPTAAGAPTATMSSMFDQLSVKDATDNKNVSDVKAVVSNGSSAFGFMNAADTSNGTASAAPTQQSFDPLKNHTHNLTPNSTQKKMMEMSPEQIQAMAYQQMMMQQQQLQMMLQQQQMAGGAGVPMVPAMGGLPMYPPLAGGLPRRTPSLGSPNAAVPNMMPASFSFAPKPAQKDDKKFDFVKDAMAGHKK